MIRRRHRGALARLGDESGIALVLAIAVMMVLTIGTISITGYSMSNENSARRYTKVQVAFDLAEAGLAHGVGILANTANATQLLTSTLIPAAGNTYTYNLGTATVTGSLDCWTPAGPISCSSTLARKATWHLTSRSSAPWHHQGRLTNISRTVHVDVPITWDPLQPANTDAWKYIYSKNTSGSPLSLGNCDETIYNNTTIEAGMYVTGNLCMNTPSEIQGVPGGNPPVNLIVKGWLEMDSNAKIGHSTPVTKVELGSGCSNAFAALAVVANCKKATYDINPGAVATTTVIPPPVADFASWYLWASPGPNAACSTSTGTPPVFDTNTVQELPIQGSVSTVVNLTPAVGYDCKTADGEIKWTPGNPGNLIINGTIYIDGSATLSPANPVNFDGEGAIYVSGTFLVKNATVCALLNAQNNGCDSSGWLSAANPDILVIAANGHGTGGSAPYDQVAAGDSVEIKSSNFQGALYGTSVVEVDTTSNAQGPMVAGKEIISQHGGSPFPQFAYLPFSTPGNTITRYLTQTPRYWSGG